MVYEDREDEFMSTDEQNLYEPDQYDEQLVDTFREQIPDESIEDLRSDESIEGDEMASVDQEFGESINTDKTHLKDQANHVDLSEVSNQAYDTEE